MRLIHPPTVAALLAAAALAAPLTAQVPVRTQVRTQAPGNGNTIVVWPLTLQTLQSRLDRFAADLPGAERALWNDVLLRAAHAPTPAAGDVHVTPVVQIGPGGGCDDAQGVDDATGRVAIIVQGGRTGGPSNRIIVQGGRPAGQSGIVVQGGRTPASSAPRPTPAGTGAIAIGPKQDDPAPPPQSLGRRLVMFSQALSAEERGALDWLLNRAASAPPVALPPGPCNPETGCRAPGGAQVSVSLRQALGIDRLAIGPKQDDPAPPPPSTQWTIRY